MIVRSKCCKAPINTIEKEKRSHITYENGHELLHFEPQIVQMHCSTCGKVITNKFNYEFIHVVAVAIKNSFKGLVNWMNT